MRFKIISLKNHKELYLSINSSIQGARIEMQLNDALSKIKKILEKKEGGLKSIIKMTIFINNLASEKICKKVLKNYYKTDTPPSSFIAMSPFKGDVAVEVWASIPEEKGYVKITYSKKIPGKLSFVGYKNRKYLYLTGMYSNREDINAGALSIYGRINGILKKSGFKPEDVFRYWLYLKNINGKERYAKLNQARTEYFENIDFSRRWGIKDRKSYPSSTGIGTQGPNILIELVALRGDAEFIPVENPFQISTDEYSKEQSVGTYTPKFCRAMILKTDGFIKIFISGTASIIGGETKHPDDVDAQTKETIGNIKRLISKDNLKYYDFNKDAKLKDFLQLRVYIRKRKDFRKVKAVCKRYFKDIPVLYLEADICRKDLLVEIEGVAMVRF